MCSIKYPIVKRNFSFDCNSPNLIFIIPFYGLCISKYEVNYENLSLAQNDFVLLHFGTCVKRFFDYLIETICGLQEEDFTSLCGNVKIVRQPLAEGWSLKIQKKIQDGFKDVLVLSERKTVRNLYKKIKECYLHMIFPQLLTRLVVKKFVETYKESTQDQDIGRFKNLDELDQYDLISKTLDTFRQSPQAHLFQTVDYYLDEFTSNISHIVVFQCLLDYELPPEKRPSSVTSGKKTAKSAKKNPSVAPSTSSVAIEAPTTLSVTTTSSTVPVAPILADNQYSNFQFYSQQYPRSPGPEIFQTNDQNAPI